MDDIDMPAAGRCDDDRLARSLMPANGEEVGGPRGALPSMEGVEEPGCIC